MNERTESILRIISQSETKKGQGRLKIYLGMVAGVGKTFAMLNTAHQLKKNGVDVLIGYVETHGRKETVELMDGLSAVERRVVRYKGKDFEEMDTSAIIFRKPQIVLVDELAHTNIPGVKHEKRFQDVLEILSHGIDVHTTLNIQHIDSLSTVVQEITNIPIQERIPDSFLDNADEIVLIDLAPEQVIERLKEGKIYPPEKVTSSLENFFTQSNLIALREIALRTLADHVNSNLRDFKILRGIPQIWKTGHRLLVPITHTPEGEYLLRSARRMALALNAQWIAGRIETKDQIKGVEQERLIYHTNLAKQLGAEIAVLHDNDYVNGLIRLVRNYEITQLLFERTSTISGLFIGHYFSLRHLITELKEVDITFIATPDRFKTVRFKRKFQSLFSNLKWKDLLIALVILFFMTSLFLYFSSAENYLTIGIFYLIFLNFFSLFASASSVIFTTLITSGVWDYFFIPPRYTFHVKGPEDWPMFFTFIMASLTTGYLTSKIRKNEANLRVNDERLSILYFLTKNIFQAQGPQKMARLVLEKIYQIFPVSAGVYFQKSFQENQLDSQIIGNILPDEKELLVANWSFLNKKTAGRFTDTLLSAKGTYIPLISSTGCFGVLAIMTPPKELLTSEQLIMLEDIARHLAIGIEKDILNENLQKAHVHQATEKAYQTLLDLISHELKTPLAAISGPATSIMDDEICKNPATVKALAQEIVIGSGRLQRLVQNLLDMGRIEAGKTSLKMKEYDIRDVVSNILDQLESYYPDHHFTIAYKTDPPPLLIGDEIFVEQALKNVIQNSCQYSPIENPIHIDIERVQKEFLVISIRDFGPGFPPENPQIVFQKFFRDSKAASGGTGLGLTIAKAIVELHGGVIEASNPIDKGALVVIHLPIKPLLDQKGIKV